MKGEITVGLDNGIYVKSNHRKITREMLPEGIVYPWDEKFDSSEGGVEILYWRKNWGLRNAVLQLFSYEKDKYGHEIETPGQVFELIKIIIHFLDKEIWDDEGDSIWEYDEIKPVLQQNIINLTTIASFMMNNPDIYLEFYDSY